ncbi:SRPBCC family protein [Gordonia insulae]|nr:SRPBCC family protein [Gordonia insulae]
MLTAELRMAATPSTVWSIITDTTMWPQWGPTVSVAQVDGDAPLAAGVQGTVTTTVGVRLPFEITEFVDGRVWAWTVAGVPATRHEVRPVRGGTVLSFGAPMWAAGYLPVLALALPRIEQIARGDGRSRAARNRIGRR